MQPIHLDKPLGPTDRGNLWRVTREIEDDRIVRTIETHFCDAAFRALVESMRAGNYPRTVEIVDAGWLSEQYSIEYRASPTTRTLGEFFEHLHWLQRLSVLVQICEVIPQWQISPLHPLGLNKRNIVMVQTAGRWLPWLLPCPTVKFASPYDLFGADANTIASLAPEFIRDIGLNQQALDMYALGVLACFALGCQPEPDFTTDEERLEAQAGGALLTCAVERSEIEPFLHNVEALRNLVQVIHRYTHIEPSVRPPDPAELRTTCTALIEAVDPGELASNLIREERLHEATQVLEWGLEIFVEFPKWRQRLAEVYLQLHNWQRALEHLEILIPQLSDPYPLLALPAVELRVRTRLNWLEQEPPSAPEELEAEGDALLADIDWLQQTMQNTRTLHSLCLRAAGIYGYLEQLENASRVLFIAIEAEPSDMHALLSYGVCWRKLGKPSEELQQIVQEAHSRIDGLTRNEMMKQEEAQQWRDEFNLLLQP